MKKPLPKPNLKYGRWGHQRRVTVAKRVHSRSGRTGSGRGRKSWLRGMPHLITDKSGTRNGGKAPRYTQDPAIR